MAMAAAAVQHLASSARNDSIRKQIEALAERVRGASPMPGLEVPFSPIFIRCQAPTVHKPQCGRVGYHEVRVRHATKKNGKTKTVWRRHSVCWQHAEGHIRVVEGGKK